MSIDQERIEREQRAKRLREARARAGIGGPTILSRKFGWKLNTYKAHESGRNGFGLAAARAYAKAFNVALQWLYFNIGSPSDPYVETASFEQEVIELLAALPEPLRQNQIENLRQIVAAIRAGKPSGPSGSTSPKDA